MFKVYATREETRRMSHDMPIGDPFGGAAYGERNDPVTGYMGYRAAGKAAKAQENAANDALGLQRQMYNQTREDYKPYREAGYTGLNRLLSLSGIGGEGDVNAMLHMDPGYQFRLQEQQNALDRAASAGGRMFSGRAQKDLAKYSGDLASQEYGNVWNRLASIAGMGTNAVQGTSTVGANYANQGGNALMQAGNARASGYIGRANAINDTYQNMKSDAFKIAGMM